MPYSDRLDYVSMMAQEHAYSMAVENLLKCIFHKELVLYVHYIVNYSYTESFVSITTHALDVGAMTPFFRAFEEREKLWNFTSECQVRDFMLLYTSGCVAQDLPEGLLEDISLFTTSFYKRLMRCMNCLHISNMVSRLVDVGIVTNTMH